MSVVVDRYGDRTHPVLVLLHGWGLHSVVWRPWLPALLAHYQVITVDLPGMGYSDALEDFSLERMADEVYQGVRPELRPAEQALWFGWSLGGIVAAQVAQRYPRQTRALVTLATNPCFVARTDHPGMDAGTFNEFQQTFAHQPEVTLKLFITLVSQGHSKPRELMKTLKLLTSNMPINIQGLQDGLELLGRDHRTLFAQLVVPRLHLYARHDGLVPVAVAQSKELDGRGRVLNEGGHACFVDQGETLLTTLLEWLAHESDTLEVR